MSCCAPRKGDLGDISVGAPAERGARGAAGEGDRPFLEVAATRLMTVGGIVSEAEKVRTRSGAYVMFATLDDLEGGIFVRDAAGEAAQQIEIDRGGDPRSTTRAA